MATLPVSAKGSLLMLSEWVVAENRIAYHIPDRAALQAVVDKLAGDKVGYRVKMRKDPNNSIVQDFVAGKALGTPREAAIRRAEWVAEHPFPPKAAGRKVRLLLCPFLLPFSPHAV